MSRYNILARRRRSRRHPRHFFSRNLWPLTFLARSLSNIELLPINISYVTVYDVFQCVQCTSVGKFSLAKKFRTTRLNPRAQGNNIICTTWVHFVRRPFVVQNCSASRVTLNPMPTNEKSRFLID